MGYREEEKTGKEEQKDVAARYIELCLQILGASSLPFWCKIGVTCFVGY